MLFLRGNEFIFAHGLTMNDVNAFISDGKIANVVSANKVYDESPHGTGEYSKPCYAVTAVPSSSQLGRQSFLGSPLVPVACVGEELVPEHVSQTPLSTPVKFCFPPGHISKPTSNSFSYLEVDEISCLPSGSQSPGVML